MAKSTAQRAADRLRDETNAFDRRNRGQYNDWYALRAAIVETISELERLAKIADAVEGGARG